MSGVAAIIDALTPVAASAVIAAAYPAGIVVGPPTITAVPAAWQPPPPYTWPTWATEVGYEAGNPAAPTTVPPEPVPTVVATLTLPTDTVDVASGDRLVKVSVAGVLTTGGVTLSSCSAGARYTVVIHNTTLLITNVNLAPELLDFHGHPILVIELMPDEHRTLSFVCDGLVLWMLSDSDDHQHGLRPTREYTASFTALTSRNNLVNTSAGLGRIIVAAPAAPHVGDKYTVVDSRGTTSGGPAFQARCRFPGTGTNILQGATVARSVTLNQNRESITLVYCGAPVHWAAIKSY